MDECEECTVCRLDSCHKMVYILADLTEYLIELKGITGTSLDSVSTIEDSIVELYIKYKVELDKS